MMIYYLLSPIEHINKQGAYRLFSTLQEIIVVYILCVWGGVIELIDRHHHQLAAAFFMARMYFLAQMGS